MATFRAEFSRLSNNLYTYTLFMDEVGQTSNEDSANFNAAVDSVKTDVVGLLGGQTIRRATFLITAS
jgi:hypothetical protein